MIRHIVAWNFADGFTEEDNKKNAEFLKKELENLINLIPGIVSIDFFVNPMESSESDIMLDSVFESEEALKLYLVHSEHVRVGGFIKQYAKNRKCMDFYA